MKYVCVCKRLHVACKWNIEDEQLQDINGILNTKTEGQNRELCLTSTPLLNPLDIFIGSS